MGARRGAGKSRPSPPSPPSKKIIFFVLYWGPFCYFFLYGGLFATFFSFWGPFHHACGCLFATFYFMVEAFFGLAPPPPPHTKISAGAHDCKEGSRACSSEIFLCDHNLVSSGHVLLRFCPKNDKHNDKL